MADTVTPDVAGESYVILERISSGGMGRIYRGVKKGAGGFQKPVVLKQLLPEFARDPEVLELFFREAYIHAALEHANIVHIIDFVTSGRDYFIVMEYVRGTDLYHVIRLLRSRKEQMPVAMACYIAKEVFRALDYAHTKTDEDGKPLGIIHRDISPTNILLSGAGEVKITDFGIAHSSADSSGFVNVRGKIAYMSPEQARGEPLDQRTDLYSAAVCFYEMIAGHRPLPSFRNAADIDAHFRKPIEPLWRIRPSCPRSLDALIRQCLAPDRDDRPSGAGEVLAQLERITNENRLFFSARRLADYLKKLLGPDPTQWAKQRSRILGSGTGETGTSEKVRPHAQDKRGHVGMEVTSIRARIARRGLPRPHAAVGGAFRDVPVAGESSQDALPPPPDEPFVSSGPPPPVVPSPPVESSPWPAGPTPDPPVPPPPDSGAEFVHGYPPPPDSMSPMAAEGPGTTGPSWGAFHWALVAVGLLLLGLGSYTLVVYLAGA